MGIQVGHRDENMKVKQCCTVRTLRNSIKKVRRIIYVLEVARIVGEFIVRVGATCVSDEYAGDLVGVFLCYLGVGGEEG